jgi:transposase
MELLTHLLPVGPLHLDTWHLNEATAQLTLRVTSTQSLGHCPVCQFPTRRIHSHYARTVADLPWATYRVVLPLNVRKFFCANGRCRRRIFTARLPQLVAPWARRTQRLAHLRAQQSELAEAIALTEDFAQLVRQRQGVQLDPWLERAAKSTLGMFQRFAQGLRDDYAAVKAGMTLPWSTGPVEGHMNRLKMLKRQMFGRARLDLLSRRFLLAPRQVQGHGQRPQKPAETPAPPAAA